MSSSCLRCCCYLVQALLLTSSASSSQWSPPQLNGIDYVSLRRRSRQLGNRRLSTIDASKSFVALLSRGGADAAIYAREEEKVDYKSTSVQDESMMESEFSSLSVVKETLVRKEEYYGVDHKRRLDDALVRAVDEILRSSMSDGTTTCTMPKIDIVHVNNRVDGVVANQTISSEYVRNFVDVAINYTWDARYRKKMKIAHDRDPCPSSRYEIVVDITQSLAYERIRPTPITMSMEFRRKLNAILAAVISRADESLTELESEMDDCFLIQDEEDEELINNGRTHPMPLFSDRVNAIVDDVSSTFASFVVQHTDIMSETEKAYVHDERIRVLEQVLFGSTSDREESCVQRLFNLHLQSLRDYFGWRYEVALTSSGNDHVMSDGGDDARTLWKSRQRDAAREAWEGFDSAVSASIPRICQPPNRELYDVETREGVFSFVEALRGLLEDMQDATTALGFDDEEGLDDIVHLRMDGQGDAVNDYSQLQSTTKRMGLRQVLKSIKGKFGKRGPSRWYERLAAKAFVIGVNYVQGWIVLQTLRREARRRDLAMPKFPLF